jgi:ribA/ribD-fused uncharacterized protein
MIDSFRGEYWFLSNFYLRQITYDGHVYASNEHAFQAAKATNERDRVYVADADTCKEAKRRGREIKCRPDWDFERVLIMLEICQEKFKQHDDLREKLIATGDQMLVEGNNWGDTYWGVCNGEGSNVLGTTLMFIRDYAKEHPEWKK